MGALCCCFVVPDMEGNVDNMEPNGTSHGNCFCPNCFIQSVKSKYGSFFGRVAIHSTPSIEGAASSSFTVAHNSTQFDAGSHLPTNMNSLSSQSLNDLAWVGTSPSHLDPKVLRKINLQISSKIMLGPDKQNGSCCADLSKESYSEDEDVCPTCLEEYTLENPKIITQCRHVYHLGCIYEWMERSEKCPICGKTELIHELHRNEEETTPKRIEYPMP